MVAIRHRTSLRWPSGSSAGTVRLALSMRPGESATYDGLRPRACTFQKLAATSSWHRARRISTTGTPVPTRDDAASTVSSATSSSRRFDLKDSAACTRYVRLDNPTGFRAASRWQQAVGTVRYLRVGRSTPWLTGISGENIPTLEEPKTRLVPERTREDAWKKWFNSWLGEPLSKRSTGCAALTDESFQSATDFIEKALRIDPDSDVVLDVGCDSAMISRLVAPHTKRFGGVDFITAMLKDAASLNVATADGHPAWFAAADACHLPFKSCTFTKVYCSAMIHTLPTHAHGLRAIDELIRVTAAKGIVLLSSVPDRSKRMAARFDLWKQARWTERISLPVRWIVPGPIKQFGRRALRRPSTGLPEFLHYDLRALQRSLEARGLRCEICDFPVGYWNDEFRTSRSNLLIHVPESIALD